MTNPVPSLDVEACVRLLIERARHSPSCAVRIMSNPCGAVNGRLGKCRNRATHSYESTQVHPSGIRHVTLYRCAGHVARNSDRSTELPPVMPCTCGLDEAKSALASALPGMGKDSEDMDWLEANVGGSVSAVIANRYRGRGLAALSVRDAIAAARAAQPEETSADAK